MKYVCPICGYVYDEEKERIPFAQLPDSWVCPLCGAAKSVFAPASAPSPAPVPSKPAAVDPDALKLSPGVLAAVFSNLARGCEKQYKPREQVLMTEIAAYFTAVTPQADGADERMLAELMNEDLTERYPHVRDAAVQAGDRGTQRICVWGEKVTRMAQSLLSRYEKEGEAFLRDNDVWICTVCGFLYIGKRAPERCPVCKVPDWKFEKIEGRA